MLYVTDLHGDRGKYEMTLKLAIEKSVKLIVNGGDMLPKQGNRHREQPPFISEYLRNYFQRLQEQGITYLAILGNDDLLMVDELFAIVCDEFDNAHNITNKIINIGGYEFIGMDSILDHPFGGKDRVVMEKDYIHQPQLSSVVGISNEFDYNRIYDWLDYSRTKLPYMCDILNRLPIPVNLSKAIYVAHMPPAGLKLGQLRYQDLDIGSVDIYEFLKEKQPLLSFHGHIHESPDTQKGTWINKIVDTTCIQTGQTELGDKELIYAEIDLKNQEYIRKKVKIDL